MSPVWAIVALESYPVYRQAEGGTKTVVSAPMLSLAMLASGHITEAVH